MSEASVSPRSKADEGRSAHLTAGFCRPWSNPTPDGTLVPDVKVGAWQMPWNARPDAGRLVKGIPPWNFWASDPNGIDQVGCVYTAQGFEFDYVGVIWGRDLRWDPAANNWIGEVFEVDVAAFEAAGEEDAVGALDDRVVRVARVADRENTR